MGSKQQPVYLYPSQNLDSGEAPPPEINEHMGSLIDLFEHLHSDRYDFFYKLFKLGEPVDSSEVVENSDHLLKSGLCIKEKNTLQSKYMIEKICDAFIITDFPHYKGEDRVLYLADDESGYFAKAIPDCRNYSVLDIGTGSGVLSIVACKRGAKSVTALDVNERALAFGKFNAVLNRCQDRINFVLEPVQKYKPAHPFDLVMSNPPFIATPPEGRYRKSGAAGSDGLDIQRGILLRLDDFMHSNSIFIMNILSPGDKLLSEIERLCLEKYYSERKRVVCTDLYGAPHDIAIIFKPFEDVIDVSKWKKEIEDKYTHIHSVFMEIIPDVGFSFLKRHQHPPLEKTREYGSWSAKYDDIQKSREFT